MELLNGVRSGHGGVLVSVRLELGIGGLGEGPNTAVRRRRPCLSRHRPNELFLTGP